MSSSMYSFAFLKSTDLTRLESAEKARDTAGKSKYTPSFQTLKIKDKKLRFKAQQRRKLLHRKCPKKFCHHLKNFCRENNYLLKSHGS